MQSRPGASGGKPPSFGKRGAVQLSPPAPVAKPAGRGGFPMPLAWIGGGIAALALMSLVTVGSGGGILPGLLGGLLAGKLLRSMSSPTTAAAPAPAAQRTPAAQSANHSVSRGGFGSTSGSFFSGG